MNFTIADAINAKNRGDYTTALAIFHAFLLDPDHKPFRASTWVNLGALYDEIQDGERAHECFRQAVALDPTSVAGLSNLGASALGWNRPEEAMKWLSTAVTLDPNFAAALNGVGTAWIQRGDYGKAIPWFDKAIIQEPENVAAHWNRSLCYLAMGRWQEGWDEHIWRKKLRKAHARTAPISDRPAWNGERLDGKRLLVHCEQGWGDMVQWARLGPILKAYEATIVWEAHKPLLPLFKLQPWCDEVFEAGKELPEHDVHTFVLDAVRILGMTPDKDSTVFPYLLTPKAHKIGKDANRKTVGLVWRGRVEHGTNELRSAPTSFAENLVAAIPEVTWVSLQKDYDPPKGAVDGRPYMTDFAQSGAVMRTLDAVVTIDSAPAHLAASLNVPTLMLLHSNPEWRWRSDLERGSSRWYRSLRFLKQDAPGNWDGLIPRIREEIAA